MCENESKHQSVLVNKTFRKSSVLHCLLIHLFIYIVGILKVLLNLRTPRKNGIS